MPSFLSYQRNLLNKGKTLGEVRKRQADQIMESTWYGDPQTRTCWLFDIYHDPDPYSLRNMEVTDEMIPIDIKFIKHTSKTYEKDSVTYHLQMKPSQEMCVPYYERFEDIYEMEFPMGLYCLVPDERGHLNRWIVVDKADADAIQFPTYELLKCDHTLEYIIDGKKCRVASVLRSQNSYNSGIWTDFKISSVEDQQKAIVPLCRETERLYYGLRMIIDEAVLDNPRTWKVSKVNRLSPNGLVRLTFAQDRFDQHNDYIETETDDQGRVSVTGQWADYFTNNVVPQDQPEDNPTWLLSEITCSGARPFLKVGGGYKTLTVNFTKEDEPMSPLHGDWFYTIAGEDASTLIVEKSTDQDNQIKIKFTGDEQYIGQTVTVAHVTDKTKATIELPIESL